MTMLVAITAGKGAPGATTLALALTLAWPRPVVLIEADPAGASIRFGYGGGTDMVDRNLTAVAVAQRRIGIVEAIHQNLVQLADHAWLLPGAPTPAHAAMVDFAAIGRAVTGLGVDVVVDVGRLPSAAHNDGLWVGADRVLVAMRSTLPAVHTAQSAGGIARELTGAAALCSILIGPGRPYSRTEVEAAMDPVAPLAAIIPWDVPAAGALADAAPPPRHIERTALLRAAASLARSLTETDPATTSEGTSGRHGEVAAEPIEAVSAEAVSATGVEVAS